MDAYQSASWLLVKWYRLYIPGLHSKFQVEFRTILPASIPPLSHSLSLSHWWAKGDRTDEIYSVVKYVTFSTTRKMFLAMMLIHCINIWKNFCIILPEHFPCIFTVSLTISFYASWAFAKRLQIKHTFFFQEEIPQTL